MNVRKKVNGDEWEVFLTGRLQYEDKSRFKDIVFCFSKHGVKRLVIDLEKLEYIDSHGLGMLLILHDDATHSEGKIILKNLNGKVKTLFNLSHLTNLFPES